MLHVVKSNFELTLNVESSFDGKRYRSVVPSEYSHRHTKGLANYRGHALTTGCQPVENEISRSLCKFKTELLNMATMIWSKGPDYPFAS